MRGGLFGAFDFTLALSTGLRGGTGICSRVFHGLASLSERFEVSEQILLVERIAKSGSHLALDPSLARLRIGLIALISFVCMCHFIGL